MSISTITCFLGASILLTLAPGPDNTFVVAQGLARGKRAAIITALGMCSGVSVHTFAAAVGISAILYSSVIAFTFLKFAGAAYLLYLAYKSFRESAVSLPADCTAQPQPACLMFRRGFMMNVLNPKVALFFLAFLPQFASPEAAISVPVQMLVFGLVFMLQAMMLFSAIGWLSGAIGGMLTRKQHVSKYLARLSGAVLALLGLRLAFASR